MKNNNNLKADHDTKYLNFFRYGCLFVLVTGILPTLAIFEVTQEPWRLFFDVLKWPLDQNPATFSESDRQLSAVLGGVLCGWAWLMYKLSDPQIFNQKIRVILIQSTIVWFVLDSGGSIISGLPLNAVSNMSFFLILLIPLIKLKK
jgi:hypothetical protein